MLSNLPTFLFRRAFDLLQLPGSNLSTLIYHRVLPKPDPMRPWEIDAIMFEKHLKWVSHVFNVISLEKAVKALTEGVLPRRSLCITFDDGYLDNVSIALPLLQTYALPATFFCTTAYINGGMMWNDEVIEAMRTWPNANISIEELELFNLPLDTESARATSAETILNKLKYLDIGKRSAISQQLILSSNYEPRQQMLSGKDIHYLHEQGMEIGGHTHSHPILANLNIEQAKKEIQNNKHLLEEIIGETIKSFAYPNGKPLKDYTSEHHRLVSDAGYNIAVTTAEGTSNKNSDPLQLPRFTPWDKTREKFLVRLALNHFRGQKTSS